MFYREYVFDSTQRRAGFICEENKISMLINEATKQKRVLYISSYAYDDNIVGFLEKSKRLDHNNNEVSSMADYPFPYYMRKLYLDFDNHSDNISMDIFKSFICEKIEEILEEFELDDENCQIYFSGGGIHVILPDLFGFVASNDLPLIVSETIKENFPDADISPHRPSGLIRTPYSYHKSGVFKTQFSFDELKKFTMEQIIDISSKGEVRNIESVMKVDKKFPGKIRFVKKKEEIKVPKYTSIAPCLQRIYLDSNHDFRHEKLLLLASGWKRQGLPLDAALLLGNEWITRQNSEGKKEYKQEEIERNINYVYTKDYSYGCNNKYLMQNCSPDCLFYNKKNYGSNIETSEDSAAKLTKMINIDVSSMAINWDVSLPLGGSFIQYPDEFVVIIGDTGVGKSAILQNLIVPMKNKRILVLNYEFPNYKYLRRNVQIETGWDKNQTIDYFKTPIEYRDKAKDPVRQLNHIINFEDKVPLSGMRTAVLKLKPDLLIVDTAEDIPVERKFGTDPIEEVTKELLYICHDLNIPVIVVHHISKNASTTKYRKGLLRGAVKLDVHSGKGASFLEQKADTLLAFEGLRTARWRVFRTLKSRDNPPFSILADFDPETFRITTVKEKYEVEDL